MKKIPFKLDSKNRPIDCADNIQLLAKTFGVKFMFDVLTDTETICIPESVKKEYNDYYDYLYHLCKEYDVPTKHLNSYISVLCEKNLVIMFPYKIK
ncbi:hypothetical protein Megpolyxen_01876 (plasmid) [Candidatus Megaera polyxenophila]|nr:hypothetical protein Megpolyxen_01876 [Candidatus Megaera polyxenophila]